MKTHWYYDKIASKRHPEVSRQQAEWVALNPEYQEVQDDDMIRCWSYVEDLEHWVRVILLPDGETLFNAFIDSNFDPPSL